MIKWEYFDVENFSVRNWDGNIVVKYNNVDIVTSKNIKLEQFFKGYRSEIERLTKVATVTSANIFSDFESVIPANFAATNNKTGHGQMAEEALTIIDKLSGKKAEVIGRTNIKDGADRLVDGIQIQTKYCSSGK
ncbi:hypothetical protein FDB23_00930 [Clostridium botulinum]|nr:hypothetical protein [Clostridium botulinum]